MPVNSLSFSRIETDHPIGPILIVFRSDALVALDFDSPEGRLRRILRPRYGVDLALPESDCPPHIASTIRAYLGGRLQALEDIPVDGGGTQFQREVWAALRDIPAGETRTYGQIARLVGRPDASRAVGAANALNPISIIVPCHRLVGSKGALTGYGGGLARKRWLLEHERTSRVHGWPCP